MKSSFPGNGKVSLKEYFQEITDSVKTYLEEKIENVRRYFEEKVSNLEEKLEAYKRENEKAVALQKSEDEKARALQKAEYDKHFLDLNGEQGRIAKILEASIPREVHDRDMKELRGLIDVLVLANKDNVTKDYLASVLKTPTEDVRDLRSYRDVSTGKSVQSSNITTLLIALFGLLIGSIGVILAILR